MRAAAVLLLVATACAPRYADREPEAREGDVVVGTVNADGTFRADTVEAADEPVVERETVTTGTIRPAEPTLVTGWRVQVFADTERATAESFASRIRGRIDAPVYVEWSDPWWKVRVGDFLDRDAAERLRERLATDGVDGAWTVRTTVRADS